MERNRAMVLDTVANIAYARGETERGIQLETEAMELNPANSEYKGVLGGFLLALGHPLIHRTNHFQPYSL